MSKSKIFDQETNNVIEWLLIAIVGAVSFVVAVVVSQIAMYTVTGVKKLVELKKQQTAVILPSPSMSSPIAVQEESKPVEERPISAFRHLVAQSVVTDSSYSIVIRQYQDCFEALAFEDGVSYDLGSMVTNDMNSARRNFQLKYLMLQTPLATETSVDQLAVATVDEQLDSFKDEFIPEMEEYEQMMPNQA